MTYVDIILPLPIDGLFTYSVPPSLVSAITFGVRVTVPFGKSKSYIGIVVSIHDRCPQEYTVKDISMVLSDVPILREKQYKLWQWISDYYMCPIGDVSKAAIPSGLKSEDGYKPRKETFIRLTDRYKSERDIHFALDILKRADRQLSVFNTYLHLSRWEMLKDNQQPTDIQEITKEELLNSSHSTSAAISALVKRGMLEAYEKEVTRLNIDQSGSKQAIIKQLNEIQQEAYNSILMSFISKNVTLLHGVTSSGKTEIYIHLIQNEIAHHRQVLYLLPEIALTIQIMDRLKQVFGDKLGIYHSKYSDAERVEIWQKQLSDHPYDVILGARSSVFLPYDRLGLVIVDEEHETSYKQQDPAPRYHARNVAIVLAHMYGAKTLLGTATPCIETYHNAINGKYGLVELTQRYRGIEMPEIEVVDVKDLQHRKMMNGPFSPLLLSKIREALEHGQQALLFQNRRGFSNRVECKQCGWIPRCNNCDVSLTLHKNVNQMTCHYCGYTYQVPKTCPCCGSPELQTRGFGTERIEEIICDVFPQAKVARMDLDTTHTRNAYERIISDFSKGETNILIGTQMISKGLDFDKVSVVGILNADNMLNYPDFRAYEQAFMMMAQVSGRAGRRGKRGLVILQTKSAELPIISQVVRNDYKSMYNDIIIERQEFHYPPFYHLVYIYIKHKQDYKASDGSQALSIMLRNWFGTRVLGPDKPSVAKVKTMNIRKIVLKLENGIDMKKVREYLLIAKKQLLEDSRYSSLQVNFDVDPS